MACLAQTQELEALNYQEHQLSALIYSFINPNAQYRKEYLSFDTIERAYQANHRKITKKTKYLSDKAKKILAPVVQKLLRGENVLLNSKYISQITGCEARQNRNILNELKGILKIKHRKFIKANGRIFKGYYLFKFTPAILYELYPTEEKANGNKLPLHIHIQNNKNIEDIDLGSNFFANSESKNQEEVFNHESLQFPKKALRNKKCLSNQRKKSTNQELKARIYFPKFKQYDKPKSLGEHYPLSTEECLELQSRSGRDFTLNAMNEILLDISRKSKESSHEFPSKATFMAYMSKVYRYEERDAVKTANLGFKILVRAKESEVIQYATQTERESYLNFLEQQAITNRSDENQLKAKWANTLPINTAYNLLSNLSYFHKVGTTLEVQLKKHVELTEYQKTQILHDTQAVGGYGGVEKLEVSVK